VTKKLLALHFSESLLVTAFLMRLKMSKYISSFTVEIPLNYTSEFRELFETTPYLGEFCDSHSGVIENSSLL
jgi:hypothetical protein